MFVDIVWWQVLAGVALDLIVGSPRRMPHPLDLVRLLARLLAGLLRRTRLPDKAQGALILVMVLSLFSTGVAVTIPWLNIYWVWVMLTLRDLDLMAPDASARLTRGVVAPLCWLALGGPAAMAGYQVVATLADELAGGTGAPARGLQRAASYLPGRLSSAFLNLPFDARKLGYGLAVLMVMAVCGVLG
jgi:cobalamin biosynthesis protein CobD/CbiB